MSSYSGSPADLGRANRQRVVSVLQERGPLSQADLARASGLSPATISAIVRELEADGRIERESVRRGAPLRLMPLPGFVLGFDYGHRHLRVAVADRSGRVLGEASKRLPLDHKASTGVKQGVTMAKKLLADAGGGLPDVVAAGMGLPAPVLGESHLVGSSSILPGWVGVHADEELAEALGHPVAVDNDANLGALAEMTWGAGRGVRDLVYLKLATGIGAGIVVGGEIVRGAAGTAGEIGHTTMDEHGDVCRCGNRGCLETVAGADTVLRMLEPVHGPDFTLHDAIDAALAGDAGCRRVIADAGRHIGIALANLVNLLSPELIVVGGELAGAGDILLNPIRDAVARYAIETAASATTLVPTELGDDAEVLGAIALAVRGQEVDALAPPVGSS
ncbi:MAG TPA: ROK family transcriptional regulator [Thermoleophilaceae bacterium]|jgi:predicted NBD/HSP70 family sugar kinase